MTSYNPAIAPLPTAWLALDDEKRIHLAVAYHRKADVKLPDLKSHALVHVVIENQIAEGVDSTVRALARLMAEGLSRHDALHAIGSVVAEYMFEMVNLKASEDATASQARYNAAVEALSAKDWRRRYGV